MKIRQERIDYIKELSNTLPPFSITVTDQNDAVWMVSAFIGHIAGNDTTKGELLSIALGMGCKHLGIEAGVDVWIEALNEKRDKPLPKFIRPLLIHHFTHIETEHKKQQSKE